jgi:trehalose 6-phosphate synthase/phosphatase
VSHCPVGVDAERVAKDMWVFSFPSFALRKTDVCRRLRPGIQPKLEALRNLYEGKKIIVGRDKLDVVKGVIQKVALPPLPAFFVFTPLTNPPQLRAFEKLLQDYPEWIGNVVMIQVTSPALTDSPKLERMVSEIVAHINGEYGSLDFIPVHH